MPSAKRKRTTRKQEESAKRQKVLKAVKKGAKIDEKAVEEDVKDKQVAALENEEVEKTQLEADKVDEGDVKEEEGEEEVKEEVEKESEAKEIEKPDEGEEKIEEDKDEQLEEKVEDKPEALDEQEETTTEKPEAIEKPEEKAEEKTEDKTEKPSEEEDKAAEQEDKPAKKEDKPVEKSTEKPDDNSKETANEEEKREDSSDSPSDSEPKPEPEVVIDDLGLPKIGEAKTEEPAEEDPKDEEAKKTVMSYTFDGRRFTYKEKGSVIQEKEGHIQFRVVNNDGKRDSLIILTGLKNIFQKQLPEMPKAYITRLVFDRSHVSIAVVRDGLVVMGGITIKPFESHHFAEIVFCAISSSEQVRGYGAHMMNHLKTYVRGTMDVDYFLTYADNYAIGYFKKQGFTKEITLPKKVWMGYIKDYEGGTLMQCSMLPRIRYLDGPKILSLQKAAVLRKIRSIGHSHVIRPGLKHFKEAGAGPMNPQDIPGIKEAGWTKEMDDLAQQPKRSPHYAVMLALLTEMQNHPSNWPFLQPVNKNEVSDYYEVIKEPMDLSTMEVKFENNAYETLEDFIYDCKLIFNNCRQYNGENTTFYKNANKLEKVIITKLKDYPEYSQFVDMFQQ